jgi:hypothetical protein
VSKIDIHGRVERKERDAIQKIADSHEWSFSKALQVVIREGLNAVTEWDGESFTTVVADEGRLKEFNRG